MPVTRSARESTSRDTDAVNPKKQAGSWLREQRQKAGLSQMDLANKLDFRVLHLHIPDRKRLWSGPVSVYGRVGAGTWGQARAVCSHVAGLLRSSVIPCSVQGWVAMNVVFLDRARSGKRPVRSNAWTPAETEELTRLYRAKRDLGGAAGFAYGETDHRDPQFYVFSSTDAEPCTACVSRLIRDGCWWYVIEDGNGNVHTEGGCLRTLVGRLCGYWSSMRHTLAAALALVGEQCACDGPFSVNLLAIADCLSAVG